MLKRRSRMCRTSTGKAIALTDRDLTIFRTLANYRYLPSTYLHAFAGGASETRFKERLGDLYHEGFIDRPEQQWEFARSRYQPAIHEIDKAGERVIAAEPAESVAPRTYLARGAHRQFSHALMICECLASIELAARAQSNLRFIPWAEILTRAPSATQSSSTPFRLPIDSGAVIPDGVFGLEYLIQGRRAYRFFALEADRGTMPVERADPQQSSYLAKLAGYREVIANNLAKRYWGISTLLVLTVTTGPERLRRMVQCSRERADSPHFLFRAVVPSVLTSPVAGLLAEPWERISLSPISIGESV